MYRNYIAKRAPVAFWMLDDTVPFQEYSGFGASGGKKTANTDPTKSVPLVAGAAFSSVFKAGGVGQFACNLFKQGLEQRPFAIEAWILPIPKSSTGNQQILSHDGIFDGLSINGKVLRFMTSYLTAGDASVTYDLQEYQLAYVVGVHTADQNQLWVNGKLVASVDITDAQKADSYVATDGYLYSGHTASTQEIAMNGVAFYPSLSGEQIYQNYLAGIETIGSARIASQLGGYLFDFDSYTGDVFLRETWDTNDDFDEGLKNNVEIGDDKVVPSATFSTGISLAGSWTVGVPLDGRGDTSVYGVAVDWEGNGITVDTSLDGTTWAAATKGMLIAAVTNGYNPTNKDLQIRVNFAGGTLNDPAYLGSLRVVGFRNNTVNNISARTATVSRDAVLRDDYEPRLYRDDCGLNLQGGTLTIGTDTNTDPEVARTLEVWIKPLTGTAPTISVTGTKYRNNAVDSTLPQGEWSLIHYVSAANISTSITISGQAIIGQVVVYPTALTVNDVDFLWDSYAGGAVARFTDSNTIGVTEAATPTQIYDSNWGIQQSG